MLLTLDFETHYADDYTLRKMTTAEYIRDARFGVHGVGIAVEDKAPVWVYGQNVAPALAAVPWGEVKLVGHNLMFDGAILAWRYGHQPKQYRDTLGMSRALIGTLLAKHDLNSVARHLNIGGKVGYSAGEAEALAAVKGVRHPTHEQLLALGYYCAMAPNSDIALTRAVYNRLLPDFPEAEWDVLDWTIRMFANPYLCLDTDMLAKYRVEVVQHKDKLCADLGVPMSDLRSNDKFAGLLKLQGAEPPMKISHTTHKKTYAFAKGDMDFILMGEEHPDPFVRELVNARLEVKSSIEETRAQALYNISLTGTLPIPLAYSGAMNSHRLSGCLVADTQILVVDQSIGMCYKDITDVLLADLVWDGEEFVAHEGVKFSGYREVIEWDGVSATPEHVVFTESGASTPISEAAATGDRIKTCRLPTADEVVHARRRTR